MRIDRVEAIAGDAADAALLDRVFASPVNRVFHLASIPGGMTEQQYALARRLNLDASLMLLERCKARVEAGGPVARFVFASSIAVFGELHGTVDEETAVARFFDTPVRTLVRWAPDPRIESLFGRYPPLSTPLAQSLAFTNDGSLDDLVRRALMP